MGICTRSAVTMTVRPPLSTAASFQQVHYVHIERVATVVTAVTALFIVATSASFAEETARAAASRRAAAEMVAKGKQLYAHHCSRCHGFNLVNPGTVAYDLRQFPHNDKDRFVHAVTQGKNGRMPQWGDVLKPEEIDEIWSYVKTGGAQ
jgi:mono/diheme cytochrome c family protein